MDIRVGQGIDVHPFQEGRDLVLGGVSIPCHVGLEGHSDADVLTHAVMDALLGAAGLPDIGHLFPNTDERFKGARSITLLEEVNLKVRARGWKISNCDITVLAEMPKIAPHIASMKQNLSAAMAIDAESIGIKATTTEKLGAVGRKEGIVTFAVVLLSR